VDARARPFELDLEVGPSPRDPLVPRAREFIERHGATVEQFSAVREDRWRHVTIHAVAKWPGRTIDVSGGGASDRQALAGLEDHVRHLAP
jgi:hypothetical protein